MWILVSFNPNIYINFRLNSQVPQITIAVTTALISRNSADQLTPRSRNSTLAN